MTHLPPAADQRDGRVEVLASIEDVIAGAEPAGLRLGEMLAESAAFSSSASCATLLGLETPLC